MDYFVGGVAALVTGNVTPSRPRLNKRALTPTKHQPSPNVTPKSEFVDDRSIFLSPSMQKKKAIVKKSPKRIFQNPDLETTDNGDGNVSLTSPKADKVKKHLKDDLDSDIGVNTNKTDSKSSKNKGKNQKESISLEESSNNITEQSINESSPKKKKKKNNSVSESTVEPSPKPVENAATEDNKNVGKSPKKMKQRRKSVIDDESNKENNNKTENEPPTSNIAATIPKEQKNKSDNSASTEINKDEAVPNANTVAQKKKNKRRKKKSKPQTTETKSESIENIPEETKKENVEKNQEAPKKKNRKRKKSKSKVNKPEAMETDEPALKKEDEETDVQNKKAKTIVNPNAITDKESDSEHESDDEIESENEEINKKVFEAENAVEESSDEDEEKSKKEQPQKPKAEKKEVKEKGEINTEDEIKRTLFVGNVPFSAKCKKEIKKIFSKHGHIDTIRIRTVPIKDGRYTPKLAVIKNELHPERTTVNVYIKFAEEASVEKALVENNTVLNEHHLRVSRSSHTGAEHDPKSSIFVGNLPFAMEDEGLREKFEKCGEIESVRIIRDKKTNAGKGFGYVNFASKDGVELALALTDEDLTIKNRIIRVKRCTQLTNKQKQSDNKPEFKKQFNQRPNQGNQRVQGGQRQNQGFQRGNQGGQRGNQGGQRENQGGQRVNQGSRRGYQGGQGGYQGGQRGNQGGDRGNQGGQRWNQGTKDEEGRDGAHRRIMQKRKYQDGNGDGPPNKKQNINQPNKEKKSRKEFVGMTAEKKKKRKFDKGQKKKKALSEILTK